MLNIGYIYNGIILFLILLLNYYTVNNIDEFLKLINSTDINLNIIGVFTVFYIAGLLIDLLAYIYFDLFLRYLLIKPLEKFYFKENLFDAMINNIFHDKLINSTNVMLNLESYKRLDVKFHHVVPFHSKQ